MAQFTTRIELHDATWANYDTLHAQMESRGLSRKIKSDDGIWYHLPTAEYNFEGEKTRSQVLDLAKASATATGRKFAVLVTESKGRNWQGLSKV